MNEAPPRPNRPVYLDNQATTRCDPRVVAAMLPWFTEQYGNPHSVEHVMGRTAEAAVEVARPGARFVNLDVSKAPNPVFKRAFDLYFYGLVPLVGGIVGGSMSAYRYLPNSLTNYPGAAELSERFTLAGFREARLVRLAGGAVAVHVGTA